MYRGKASAHDLPLSSFRPFLPTEDSWDFFLFFHKNFSPTLASLCDRRLISSREDNFIFFFFPPRRRRWPNFRGHVTFPPSFYFRHLFNSIEVVYGMVGRDGEMAIEYRDWDTIERVNRVIPWFLRAPFVSRLMRCWVLQIDFLFFLFCWSHMRGVQIYIYMVFCRS